VLSLRTVQLLIWHSSPWRFSNHTLTVSECPLGKTDRAARPHEICKWSCNYA